MAEKSSERRLTEFIAKFSPDVARTARSARTKIHKLLPDAFELVYDNYNALAIAFGPTERASDIILSIALYPRWVSLFFARGASLPDPSQALRGTGNQDATRCAGTREYAGHSSGPYPHQGGRRDASKATHWCAWSDYHQVRVG